MTLDLSAANLVRAASGALFALFGLALVVLPPRRRETMALGAAIALMGPWWTLGNILFSEAIYDDLKPLYVATFILAWPCLAYAIARAAPTSRTAWTAIGGAAVFALPFPIFFSFDGSGEGLTPWQVGVSTAFSIVLIQVVALFLAFAAMLALRAWRTTDAREARGLARVAFGIALWPTTYLATLVPGVLGETGAQSIGIGHVVSAASTIPLLAAPIILWALARSGPARGSATAVAIGLSVTVVMLLMVAEFGRATGIDLGEYGLARLIALPFFVTAVFRDGALGLDVRSVTANRAAIGGTFLAVLFIVAQVAQNFLAAQYGLLMGSVVAGAFLFAAKPIERALEGRREERALPTTAGDDDGRRAVYRDAARRSLRDGIVTREEEMHLAKLARHLALPADDALAIRHEVEDELRGHGGGRA